MIVKICGITNPEDAGAAVAGGANALGFNGHYFYSYAFYDVNPNNTAAFPSLHAAFPFLSFLVLRRAFGRIGWLAFAYFLLTSFSIVYLGDHYVIDVLAGVAFAAASYAVVVRAPSILSALAPRLRTASPAVFDRDWRGIFVPARYSVLRVVSGLVMVIAGIWGIQRVQAAHATATPLYLLPWAVMIVGLLVAGTGLGTDLTSRFGLRRSELAQETTDREQSA